MEAALVAELVEAQPVHACNKRLQLIRHLGRPQPEAPVRQHHDHRQALDLGMLLQKTEALGGQAVVKAHLAVHLHLEKIHGLLWGASATALPLSLFTGKGSGDGRQLQRLQAPSECWPGLQRGC